MVIRDKGPLTFEFKHFSRLEMRAKLVEILGGSIITSSGEAGLKPKSIILFGKGSLDMKAYEIVGFTDPKVWNRLNSSLEKSTWGGDKHNRCCNPENLTIIAKLVEGKPDSEAQYIAAPSQLFSDASRLNNGFRRLGQNK